jgi:hypothetical protein
MSDCRPKLVGAEGMTAISISHGDHDPLPPKARNNICENALVGQAGDRFASASVHPLESLLGPVKEPLGRRMPFPDSVERGKSDGS